MLTLSTFEEAAKKVKEVTQETKLIYSPNFSKEAATKFTSSLKTCSVRALTRYVELITKSAHSPMMSVSEV